MIFSNSFIRQIKKNSKDADNIIKIKDLKACLSKTNTIIEQPPVEQVINFIENQIDQSLQRLGIIEIGVLNDFTSIEKEMRATFDNPEAQKWFDSSRKYDTRKGFPLFKKHMLIDAWEYLSIEKDIQEMQKRISLPMALWQNAFVKERKEDILKFLNDLFQTSNVLAWEKESLKCKDLRQILLDINYIKKFRRGLNNTVDPIRLKEAIQNVCVYLVYVTAAGVKLKSLEIENLSYEYRVGKNLAGDQLKLFINNANPLSIKGGRARKVHDMLINPWETIEFTDDSVKNNRLHKDFDDINCSASKKWYLYGFTHGAFDLIRSEGYSHSINCELTHLIKKKI